MRPEPPTSASEPSSTRIGGALAAPFAGIFKTASTTSGTVIVWADILAVVVYAIAATIVAKVVSMSTDQRARRSI